MRNLFLSNLALACLVAALIALLPAVASAHEADSASVAAAANGSEAAQWCAHDDVVDPFAGHGAHCFAPAFASFASGDHVAGPGTTHAVIRPTDQGVRRGLNPGAEPPPPRLPS